MATSQLAKDYLGYGTHAARPATPNTGTGIAPVYYETDTTNTFVWSGSAWVQVNGGGGGGLNLGWTAPPLVATWTKVNQGSAGMADGTNPSSILLQGTSDASYNLHGLVRSTPATPYTVIGAFYPTLINSGVQSQRGGLCWRLSSNDHWINCTVALLSSIPTLLITEWASQTGGPASTLVNEAIWPGSPTWMKLGDDGTNRTVWISNDGYQWQQVLQHARTTYITPDQIGICIDDTADSILGAMSLVSWTGA